MTHDGNAGPEHEHELPDGDLELADDQADQIGGGDKGSTGRANISDLPVTKYVDKPSTK